MKKKKVREHKKKKRLSRKNFKLLDFVKMGLEKLWQTDFFRIYFLLLLITV